MEIALYRASHRTHPRASLWMAGTSALRRTHDAMRTFASPTFLDSPTATSVMCCSAVNIINHLLPTLAKLRPADAGATHRSGHAAVGRGSIGQIAPIRARRTRPQARRAAAMGTGTHEEKSGSSAMPLTIRRRSDDELMLAALPSTLAKNTRSSKLSLEGKLGAHIWALGGYAECGPVVYFF